MVDVDDAPVSPAVRLWRFWLIVGGLLLLAIGGVSFLVGVNPQTYVGVAAWLIAAIILHDGVAAMAVFGVTVLARRVEPRIPFAVLAVVQAGAVVAVVVTVLVAPEIIKQAIGSANPTILPLNYVGNLVVFNAAVAGVTVVVAGVVFAVTRRRRAPTPSRRTGAQTR